jgi:hypothetical protein
MMNDDKKGRTFFWQLAIGVFIIGMVVAMINNYESRIYLSPETFSQEITSTELLIEMDNNLQMKRGLVVVNIDGMVQKYDLSRRARYQQLREFIEREDDEYQIIFNYNTPLARTYTVNALNLQLTPSFQEGIAAKGEWKVVGKCGTPSSGSGSGLAGSACTEKCEGGNTCQIAIEDKKNCYCWIRVEKPILF